MDLNSIGSSPWIAIITAIAGVLGTQQLWQYVVRRMELRAGERKEDKADDNLYRDDLRRKVDSLEEKLEKANLRINDLVAKLAALEVKCEFLANENKDLKSRLSATTSGEHITLNLPVNSIPDDKDE